MMFLIIVLFVHSCVPLAWGYGTYDQNYEGFDTCGLNGWTCGYVGVRYEITYTCGVKNSGARVWVWTARFPMGTEIFTVRNCTHLEVHIDCPKGSRSTPLQEFRVYDTQHLEFLSPILPGVFLHDNDQIPQSPPLVHLENVNSVDFFPGIFDKHDISRCKYKLIKLATLEMVNVTINNLPKYMFNVNDAKKVLIKNSRIKKLETNSINIEANSLIINTSFPDLPTQAITLKSENISFIKNSFKKIDHSGLKVSSKNFLFLNNTVEEIGNEGLNVMGAKVDISHNVFEHLGIQALEVITPAFSPKNYEPAFRFVYKFSHNFLKNINPGSLHFNWEVYSKLCVNVEFNHNLFECSCMNLGWVSITTGLGPKITKVKEFYDTYLYNEGNTCYGFNGCSLVAVLSQIQDVCNNKTNVTEICKAQKLSTANQSTTIEVQSSTPVVENPMEYKGEIIAKVTLGKEISSQPALSYMENKSVYEGNQTILSVVITLIVMLALAAVCVSAMFWWFKKKQQKQVIHNSCTTLYKNEKENDADSLIVIHEHHNELYDK